MNQIFYTTTIGGQNNMLKILSVKEEKALLELLSPNRKNIYQNIPERYKNLYLATVYELNQIGEINSPINCERDGKFTTRHGYVMNS